MFLNKSVWVCRRKCKLMCLFQPVLTPKESNTVDRSVAPSFYDDSVVTPAAISKAAPSPRDYSDVRLIWNSKFILYSQEKHNADENLGGGKSWTSQIYFNSLAFPWSFCGQWPSCCIWWVGSENMLVSVPYCCTDIKSRVRQVCATLRKVTV